MYHLTSGNHGWIRSIDSVTRLSNIVVQVLEFDRRNLFNQIHRSMAAKGLRQPRFERLQSWHILWLVPEEHVQQQSNGLLMVRAESMNMYRILIANIARLKASVDACRVATKATDDENDEDRRAGRAVAVKDLKRRFGN